MQFVKFKKTVCRGRDWGVVARKGELRPIGTPDGLDFKTAQFLWANGVVELLNCPAAEGGHGKWRFRISPEAYLRRFPDGPNAEYARRVLNERGPGVATP